MRTQIACINNGKTFNVAWISFLPDSSISFGLNDRTFVVPEMCIRNPIFNAYNRIKCQFFIPTNPKGLRSVTNPHFTYHPPNYFHLVGKVSKYSKNSLELFMGLCEPEIVLTQQDELQWIRAVSKPINELKLFGSRQDSIPTEIWKVECPSNDVSIGVAIDLLKIEHVKSQDSNTKRKINFAGMTVSISITFIKSTIPTLSWFHES